MRKKKTILMMATSFLLFGCGEKAETHTFSEAWKNDETYHWHECTVEGHDDISEKASHTFREWTTLTEAGVHKDRVDHRLCTACNYEEKKTISDTGTHSYNLNEWKKDETGHWHESTCEHTTPLTIDFSEHSGEWIVKTEATYTSNRIDETDCSVCGYHEEKEIENSKLNKKSRELSVGDMTGLVYNGLEQGIPDSKITRTNDIGGLKVEYREKGSEVYTTNIPVDALTYEYRVTLTGTEEWEEKVVTGEYSIAKATVNIYTSKSSFTDKTTTNSFGLFLYSIDVSTISNNALDYVNVFAPAKYAAGGVHSIPTTELTLDNSNFSLNTEGLDTISLVNYDTSAFIAEIYDRFVISSNTIIYTTIYQGTIKKGESIYIYGLNKTAVVESIEYYRKEVDKATKGQKVGLKVPSLSKDELENGMMFTKSSEAKLETSLTISSSLYVLTQDEGGQHTPLISNSDLTLKFNGANSGHLVRITILNDDKYIIPGKSSDKVIIEFCEEVPNWENREFNIYNAAILVAKGTVTALHNHSEEFASTGICSCGITHQENLTLDSSGVATSKTKSYLFNEFMVYNISLTDESGRLATGTKYQFTLSDTENFSMKVYSTLITTTEVTLDSSNCYTVKGIGSYKIIITRTKGTKNDTLPCIITIAKQ